MTDKEGVLNNQTIKAHTRAEVIAGGKSGDAVLRDLWSNEKVTVRLPVPEGYDHSDWQPKTEADRMAIIRIAGKSWNGRPATLTFSNGFVTCISWHSRNHSVLLFNASLADNFGVSPQVTRATEKDANGNFMDGHHCCIHYADSWRGRADTAYTRDMRSKCELAVVLANAMSAEQFPNMPLLLNGSGMGSMASTREFVREAQRLINRKGYLPPLTEDGGFGPLTRAGVEWVQREYGLEVCGMVTIHTWRILRADEGDPTVDEQEISGTGDSPSPPYVDATAWAAKNGIFPAADGNFNWQGQLTREQTAQALYNYTQMLESKMGIKLI